MPTGRRSRSRPERPKPILVAALSGRALAAAARRSGEPVIVLDLFADEDTDALARACRRLPSGPRGPDPGALLAAVAEFKDQVGGLVYGAGFDHAPALLASLAALVPLLGNPAGVVAAVKDPLGFAALLARLGIPHPETRIEDPRQEGWLRKAAGGAGGGHVRPSDADATGAEAYFQRRVAGRPVSALFLADGRQARVLGLSEQWSDATAAAPFRYGGCAGPVGLEPAMAEAVDRACDRLVAATGLVGLNSLDLLVDGGGFHALEINPRPGATLDAFDSRHLPLWRLHRRAIGGRLPARVPALWTARAAAIVYAPHRLVIPAGFAWPSWAADRGWPGTVAESGEPLCTVRASAGTVVLARQMVAGRARLMLSRLLACQGGEARSGVRLRPWPT